jgi:hypothetical protein
MKKIGFLLALIGLFTTFAFSQTKPAKKMKRTPEQLRLEATYARPDGKDFIFTIRGSAYAFIPGERPFKLFGMDGYNIRRRVETPEKDGFFLATREIVFYTDPKTGEIIDEWENPWTKEKCEVFHIANDPVNGRIRIKDGKYISVSMDGKREFGEMTTHEELGDYLVWHSDVFPFYPLPNFTKNYTAAELFDFYVPKKYLYNNEIPRNVYVSWTRVGPWLPWMKMGNREGLIVYHARSERLEDWNLLPEKVKARVKKDFPVYMTAPDKVDPNKPNETSWTYYNRIMEERKNK